LNISLWLKSRDLSFLPVIVRLSTDGILLSCGHDFWCSGSCAETKLEIARLSYVCSATINGVSHVSKPALENKSESNESRFAICTCKASISIYIHQIHRILIRCGIVQLGPRTAGNPSMDMRNEINEESIEKSIWNL
jgi:hypothetical protein